MSVIETQEQELLRSAVAKLAQKYGYRDYVLPKARRGEPLTELWDEAGKLGFLGVNLPEEYGGGGAGIYELALVQEELAAAGAGLLLMVVSPAICGTIIAKFGTDEQKQEWLPRLADGSAKMVFGITEPDAGSNSHQITTTARCDGDSWILNGRKVFISGVDQADAVLIVARSAPRRAANRHRRREPPPALFIVPTDAENFVAQPMEMDIVEPDHQFMLFFDDVRLPARRAGGAGAQRPDGTTGCGAGATVRRAQPRADPRRGDGGRDGPLRAGPRRRVCQPAIGVEDDDRCAPGHCAPVGADQDRDRACED